MYVCVCVFGYVGGGEVCGYVCEKCVGENVCVRCVWVYVKWVCACMGVCVGVRCVCVCEVCVWVYGVGVRCGDVKHVYLCVCVHMWCVCIHACMC